jgi:hypothetical protein
MVIDGRDGRRESTTKAVLCYDASLGASSFHDEGFRNAVVSKEQYRPVADGQLESGSFAGELTLMTG